MSLTTLLPWKGVAIAFAAAFAWGFVIRRTPRAELAGAAAAIGIALGWIATLGLITASPRQLAERLPLLALGLLAWGIAAEASPRLQRLLPAFAAAALLGTAWWLAGAPTTRADLARIAPLGLVLLVWCGLLSWRIAEAPAALGAGIALAAGIAAAAPRGPVLALALTLPAALAGALLSGAPFGLAARLAAALGLAAIAAIPVIARGAPADWAAAAAPLALLLLGPVIAARFGARLGPAMGFALAAAPCLLAALWFSVRSP